MWNGFVWRDGHGGEPRVGERPYPWEAGPPTTDVRAYAVGRTNRAIPAMFIARLALARCGRVIQPKVPAEDSEHDRHCRSPHLWDINRKERHLPIRARQGGA